VSRPGLILALAATLQGGIAAGGECAPRPWPLWEAYAHHFISPDGRVIDHGAGAITTSEGQSYALFFALVAGDRPLFEKLLGWTRNNLAHGHLAERLPAYKWGHQRDGKWGVLDENSAADADLWIGYVLVEAGRLWGDEELAREGRALLSRVVAHEVADLPGLGPMLLPAPHGFVLAGGTVRLNPSYLPLQLLRGLEAEGVAGPWRAIADGAVRMIDRASSHGFIADWVGWKRRRGFIADPVKGPIGSYDAIRVYLWEGLLDPRDPAKAAIAARLGGPIDFWSHHGQVPEHVHQGAPDKNARGGPVGFLAILLPVIRDPGALQRLEAQIESTRRGALYGEPPRYYDHNLLLFARGFTEGRYRFASDGRLSPEWSCPTM
jgi:endoglucanase